METKVDRLHDIPVPRAFRLNIDFEVELQNPPTNPSAKTYKGKILVNA